VSVHLLITGAVQGVGYRATFAQVAVRLGLRGWVRNRQDGSVEACVQGSTEAIDAIVDWAKRGPPAARVDDVIAAPTQDEAEDFSSFRILPTL
jgi:acylphosphatase